MKYIHLIKQHDEKDCGAACLSMVLQHFGRKLTMAELREAIQVDQQGATMYGVLEGARENGLAADALEGPAEELFQAIDKGELPTPLVARILNRGIYEHYVVLSAVKGEQVYLCDPDLGRRKLTRAEFAACYLGQVITFRPTEQFQRENKRKGSLRRFLGMIGRQKGLVGVIGLLSLCITAIGLAGTFLFQYLIDDVLGGMSGLPDSEEAMEVFAVLLAAVGLLYLCRFLVELLRGKLLTVMSKRIDLPLMLGYYDHVADLPMRFFDTRKTGEIMSRFNDAAKIRDAISGVTLTLMIDVVLVAVCGVVLFRASAELFCIAMCIFTVYLLVSLCYVKPLDRCNRDLMERNAQFSSYLKETIDGMETVKSFRSESTVKEKTGQLFRAFVHRNAKGSMLSLSKEAIIDCVTSLGTLVLLWVGGVNVYHGAMTLGTLITFNTLLGYFLTPVQNLVEIQSSLQTALVAADRLNDVLDLRTEARNPEGACPVTLGDITFDHVSFRYGTRQLVLKDLDFSVPRGQTAALVGESGCGKSTITKLLLGLYRAESGTIRVGGQPVEALSLDYLRSQTAYVPQTTFLFSDTIRNNLLLGLTEAQMPSQEELERVLDACCCGFVKELPMGMDTMLEENGTNLSGGQRQRLAIARALIRKPQILILDEATSSLDTITERSIQAALEQLCPGMTVLMVAHRLSTVHHCDQIFVVDHGHIIERGTHQTLLQKGQRYASLWEKQNGSAA